MIFFTGKHNHELTFWFFLLKVGDHLLEGAPDALFVNLGDLTTTAYLSVGTEELHELL